MKFVSKVLFIVIFSINFSHARELVILNVDKETSKEAVFRVQRVLTKYLGIPKKFITIKNVTKKKCMTINKLSVIGICINQQKVNVFHVNRRVYKNTLKKIIELHRSSKNGVKDV